MKLNYEEANDLYSLLTNRYNQDVEDELVYKLGGAINLVDECAKTSDSKIIIHSNECEVFAYMEYERRWPDYLRQTITKEHQNYRLDLAKNDHVTVELIRE